MSRSEPQKIKYRFAGLRDYEQIAILKRLNVLPVLTENPERNTYLMTQVLDKANLWPLVGRSS